MNKVYIWLDSIQLAPVVKGYTVSGCHSVNEAKREIEFNENLGSTEFIIDIDNNLGDYDHDGGQGINLLVWLVATGRNNNNYQIKLHLQNPVEAQKFTDFITKYWEN